MSVGLPQFFQPFIELATHGPRNAESSPVGLPRPFAGPVGRVQPTRRAVLSPLPQDRAGSGAWLPSKVPYVRVLGATGGAGFTIPRAGAAVVQT